MADKKEKSSVSRTDRIREHYDPLAKERGRWIQRRSYYYKELLRTYKFYIPEGASVLELGCGTGFILSSLKPSRGVGIDISPAMIEEAKRLHSELVFIQADIQTFSFEEKFDYIILSEILGEVDDVQRLLERLKGACHEKTRIIIEYYGPLWESILLTAERFGFKMPRETLNWLSMDDVSGFLELADYHPIRKTRRILFPLWIPLLSSFFNHYLSRFVPFNWFCLHHFVMARPLPPRAPKSPKKVSVVIAARNEAGNIEDAVKCVPEMGLGTEIIFVEGGSKDNTLEEIRRVAAAYPHKEIQVHTQDGKGKGDAVRKGFEKATGDLLMILDADLTVPPEDLPKFYNAYINRKGDFINGSRLVYPMEKRAMRPLNYLGNRFFSLLFTWLLDQRIGDTLCGTKVLSKRDYEQIRDNRDYFGDFDPFGDFDLLFGAAKQNMAIRDLPIRYRERTYGDTNISRFSHGWLLLKMSLVAFRKLKLG